MSSIPETFVEGFHEESDVRKMEYRKQQSGQEVSVLSLGTSTFGDVYSPMKEEQVEEIVRLALKAGVNLIDSAYWYGQGKSESRLGKALANVPRQAYYINTKCGRYEKDVLKMFDFSAERTLRAVDDAIDRLGCGYIDCMQIHDPEYAASVDEIVEQTLPALQKAKDAGKIKRIGLTGYPLSIHKEIIERSTVKIDSCLFYCHYSLNDTSLLDSGMLDYVREQGIDVINASPVSMGLLTEAGPPKWHPASQELQAAARHAAQLCKTSGVNISKIAIDFSLREKRIPTTLLSATSVEEMSANIGMARNLNQLSPEEEKVLQQVREQVFANVKDATWEEASVKGYWDLYNRASAGETGLGTLSSN